MDWCDRAMGSYAIVIDDEVDLHAARAVIEDDVLGDALRIVLPHLAHQRHLAMTRSPGFKPFCAALLSFPCAAAAG